MPKIGKRDPKVIPARKNIVKKGYSGRVFQKKNNRGDWDRTRTVDKIKTVADVAGKGVAVAKFLMDYGPAITSMVNDPKWYMNYPGLTEAAEGLQFNRPNGLVDKRSIWSARNETSDIYYTLKDTSSYPTVASLQLILAAGDFDNRQNALNRIYNAMRRVNTGSVPYTVLDIDKFIWNYRLLLALHSIGRKAYGIITQNSIYDVNKPAQYFAAMGLDYDTFKENAVLLRTQLNLIADQMKIYAPYNLDLFKRTAWLFDNIFATSDGVKDQEYLFSLWSWQKYWDYTADESKNVYVTLSPSATAMGITYPVWMATLLGQVNVITINPINSIIAGDMAKAFGVEYTTFLPYTDENYKAPVVLDKNALLQIWNATITNCYGNQTGDTLTVNSAGTMLVSTYVSHSGNDFYNEYNPLHFSNFLNFDFDDIKRGDILEATRLQCWVDETTGKLSNFGTEFVSQVTMIKYDSASTYPYHFYRQSILDIQVMALDASNELGATLQPFLYTRSFDYFPKFRGLFYWGKIGNTGAVNSSNKITSLNATTCYTPYIYNWSNWAEVSKDEGAAINNVAVSSLYYVPLTVKAVKDVLAVD